MRFMIMVRANALSESEPTPMPSEELMAAMVSYHEELAKAGVLLDGSGLQPSSKGWRIRYEGDKRTVIDGPFAETKEQLLGFYTVECDDLEEAVGFARELSDANPMSGCYEIRPVGVLNPVPATL